jgi:lipopolysaccharide transport system ATP-binding protein
MSNIAIRAENLSKQYKIGVGKHHNTLRDQLVHGVKSLFQRNGRPHAGKDTFWALQDISFEIMEGESVGIIGHNGAGKSTLLKILSRITEPTKGRAEIYGRLGSLLEVGTGFSHELTGRENLYLSGAILGMQKAEIERKFDQIVAFAEIEEFIDTPVKHYSSGMYVRLAFAVAAHLEPDILLIDEVLSVGDLAFQRKCMEYAKRLQEQHTTMLFVSHNMFAIKAMCNRVIYISGGQVRFDGAPEDAIQLYEQGSQLGTVPWAQGLVGAAPSQCPIYLEDIELCDEDGQSRTVFDYGDRMLIRLTFEAPCRVMDPNVNVSFIRSDNVACCNYNMAMDGLMIPSLVGRVTIEALTPPLKLVSELYTMQVMVWDAKFEKLYSAQMGMTFHVRHQVLNTHFGVFHESAEWSWRTREDECPQTSMGLGVERS